MGVVCLWYPILGSLDEDQPEPILSPGVAAGCAARQRRAVPAGARTCAADPTTCPLGVFFANSESVGLQSGVGLLFGGN